MERWSLCGLALLVACENHTLLPDPNAACLAVEVPGIVVLVHDSTTGMPAAHNAVGIIDRLRPRGVPVRDTLHLTRWIGPEISPETAVGLSGAYGRPGTYNVRVEKNGYRTWTVDSVDVTAGVCFESTVNLHALLQLAP
jgi:hypothetical protein